MSQIRTSVMFDMRAPAFGTPTAELYAAALDMAAYADEAGAASVNLMEHHASEDGYLPQPFVMGGGVAARTKRCRISLGAVILPLHDPVKIAEQIAVLDLMSNGRLQVIFGAGYVAEEFAAFGVSLKDRGVWTRDGDVGPRRDGDIGFAALRGGDVVGEHRVIFAGPGERIELAHIATDRGIFARGAVKAALWGRGKGPGLFSMMDVLGLG